MDFFTLLVQFLKLFAEYLKYLQMKEKTKEQQIDAFKRATTAAKKAREEGKTDELEKIFGGFLPAELLSNNDKNTRR